MNLMSSFHIMLLLFSSVTLILGAVIGITLLPLFHIIRKAK